MPLGVTQLQSTESREKTFKLSDFDELFPLTNASGTKLWRMKYRAHGKERFLSLGLLSLGKYRDVGLGNARRLKDEARAFRASGRVPGAEKQDRKRFDHACGFLSANEEEARILPAEIIARVPRTGHPRRE